MNKDISVGERIKQRRIELGLTQEELAHKLGNKSRASVCTVEKDKEDMTMTRVKQYAVALECTPSYIMGWEDKDGNPIETMIEVEQFDASNYRPEFLRRAIAYYKDRLRLPPEQQEELDDYIKYLRSKSDPLYSEIHKH